MRRHFVSEVANRKDVSNFVWTDDEEELLLRITNEYKGSKTVDRKCRLEARRSDTFAPNGSSFLKETLTLVYTVHKTVSF